MNLTKSHCFIFNKELPLPISMVLGMVLSMFLSQAVAKPPIRISEVLPDNKSGLEDSRGKNSDWFEIENTSDVNILLSDYGISDSLTEKDIWRFPESILPPGKKIVFFANGKKGNPSFKLSAQGESLWLFKKNGEDEQNYWSQVSHFPFPDIDEDQAYGYDKSGLMGYLESPTPGSINSKINQIWYAKDFFSLKPQSGLFQPEEKVEISLSNEEPLIEIRYSSDGTSPNSPSSTRWEKDNKISIGETTTLRFGFFLNGEEVAPQQARSFLYHNDLFIRFNKEGREKKWPINWGRNATYYGPPQQLIESWEWDEKLEAAFSSIPIFSLIVNPEDLFDYENGIYANSPMKGRNWERHCIIEYIPNDKSNNGQSNAGVRIRGGFSRSTRNPKHSFRFFFRKSYGEPKFNYDLFPDKDGVNEFDHLDLRCSQNYSWSFQGDPRAVFVRDQFNRDLQLNMERPAARGDFCHLFINGFYWGLYNSCERPEASYGNSYIGGKKKNFDVIKSAGFNWAGRYTGMPDDRPRGPNGFTMHIEATDGNLDAWKQLWDLTRLGEGMKDLSNYAFAIGKNSDGSKANHNPLLDPANLADYMLIILSMGNKDAPLTSGGDRPNNWYAMRNRKDSYGFQFFVWDAEHSVLANDLHQDRTGPYLTGDQFEYSNPQYLWEQCILNPEFQFLVKDRVHIHFSNGGTLHPKTLVRIWEKRVNEIDSAVVAESARWGSSVAQKPAPWNILNREDHWLPAVRSVSQNYLPYRPKVIFGQLQAAGLTHTLPLPEVSDEDSGITISIPHSLTGSNAEIRWTESGNDPRVFGGNSHIDSKAARSPVKLGRINQKGILARIKISDNWGPLLDLSEKATSTPQDSFP